MGRLKRDAYTIIDDSIEAVLPEAAVIKALNDKKFNGNIVVISIGKAAWNMAEATRKVLGDNISKGLIVTKYDHAPGEIEGFEIIEAGHPIPDENSVRGATRAIEIVSKLDKDDQIIFLISGGGSAIFEQPLDGVELDDIMDITDQLLGSGADIIEINTIRKRLSAVKGGRFAEKCEEVPIYSIVLSDVIGDQLDSIASGPAYPDSSTSEDAINIIEKYNIKVDKNILELLKLETPKEIKNCETVITGSVSSLCEAASQSAKRLGYEPLFLTSTLDCEAKEAGKFMAAIAREIKLGNSTVKTPCAVIAGGETVVKLKGKGQGGRNQELALSAAFGIENLDNILLFSIGSDGTDGPTDAAGGMVDCNTISKIKSSGIDPVESLNNNDSYNALKRSGDLIMTGSTGTNVNDLIVLLCD